MLTHHCHNRLEPPLPQEKSSSLLPAGDSMLTDHCHNRLEPPLPQEKVCPSCRYATSMPVLHNAALGPHAGYHATRAACRLPVPHACTLLDMAGVRSTRSTCPPRVLRCPANLAYKLPHEMQVPARGVRPPSFKYILLYLGGWILRRPEAPPAPVQAFEGEREVSGTLHARNLRGQGGSVLLRGAVLALHAGLCGGKRVQCCYGVWGAVLALHAGLSLHGNRGLGVALRGPPCPPPSPRKGGRRRRSGRVATQLHQTHWVARRGSRMDETFVLLVWNSWKAPRYCMARY